MRSTSRQPWQREQRDDLTLREVLYALWSRRVLVAAVVAILVVLALSFSLLRAEVYEAEAVISVEPRSEGSPVQDPEAFANEVLQNVDSRELHAAAAGEAGWQSGLEQFERRIGLQPFGRQDGGEPGIRASFAAPEPATAARAANAYAALFAERVNRQNDRLAGGSIAARAGVQERAARPEYPSRPRPLLYSLLAAGAGLLAGGVLALVLESRTQSWRGARDAELTLRAPVLGVIPDYSDEGEA